MNTSLARLVVLAAFAVLPFLTVIAKDAPAADDEEKVSPEAELIENLEAMLDSATELNDDPAIIETARMLLDHVPNNVDAFEACVAAYLRGKDAANARLFAGRYVAAWPRKPESHLSFADACGSRLPGESLQAASGLMAEHLAQASQLMEPGAFDRQEELAEAYDNSQQYHLARLAYLDFAALKDTSETSRKEAVVRADEIVDDFERHAVITISSLWETEGTLVGFDEDVYMGLWQGWLMGLHAHSDWLDSRGGIERFGRDDRHEVLITGRRIWPESKWQLDAELGVALNRDTSPVAGVKVKKTMANDFVYKAGFYANERATDSQLLVREGGRQHRAVVEAELPLTKKLEIQASAYIRKVNTDDGSLGWGSGSTIDVEWRPFTHHQGITLGYEWEYSRFHFDRSFEQYGHPPVRDFIYQQTNTHLAVIDLKQAFGAFTVDLRLAGGRAMVQHKNVFDPALSLSYRVNNNCRVSLVYEYDSPDGKQVSSGDSNTLSLAVNFVF